MSSFTYSSVVAALCKKLLALIFIGEIIRRGTAEAPPILGTLVRGYPVLIPVPQKIKISVGGYHMIPHISSCALGTYAFLTSE